jgi:hypothetical protein
MNNILAAKVLISHLPEITDGAYKTATEIAIETLFKQAKGDYWALKPGVFGVSLLEYLGITQEQYDRYVK